MKIFARVGIPEEILTDQGSNFTSQLLAEIYQLLHVHPIRTTPTVVVHNPTANVRNGNTGDIMEHPTVIDYEFEPFNSRAVSSIQEVHIAHLLSEPALQGKHQEP